MTITDLKRGLAAILTQEESANWEGIEMLSERLYDRLTTEPDTPKVYPHEDVVGYLAGFARRRSDPRFAAQQRAWLQTYLRAS